MNYLCHMYLYNTTYKVSLSVIADFTIAIGDFIIGEKELESHGVVLSFYKIEGIEERDGMTFCLHYLIKDIETFNMFVIVIDSKFKNKIRKKFGEDVLFFSTLMKRQKI